MSLADQPKSYPTAVANNLYGGYTWQEGIRGRFGLEIELISTNTKYEFTFQAPSSSIIGAN